MKRAKLPFDALTAFTCLTASLIAVIVVTDCLFPQLAIAQQATYADPAVPLLQLPMGFRSRRTTSWLSVNKDRPVDMLNVKSAGCVRHIWIYFQNNIDFSNAEIEITVDDVPEPQVRMPLRSFLGMLLGFKYYHINSAGLTVFPNFTVTNDPKIPLDATPGFNFYLPIPFAKSCRITIHSDTQIGGGAMVDWQQYPEDVELTPLRLYAQRNIALPAVPSEPFPIVETEGTGFLAGYIMGYRQKDHNDMVFHNSGIRTLIDGQTDPHVICGRNVEDDFGFSWGFNDYQTRWAGCPYRDNRGRNDQDGVFYRFFGPDPILFQSSLIFTSHARADDYEAVSYFYKVPNSQAPQVVSPENWQAVGPFLDGKIIADFQQPAEEILEQLSQTEWPQKFVFGTTEYYVSNLKSKYAWLRLDGTYQENPPFRTSGHSVYVHTTLKSDTDRQATLRLGLDNWAIVYLNGNQVAMLNHAEEFETTKIPISLRKGDNQLLIKTNNLSNRNGAIWAINCVIE